VPTVRVAEHDGVRIHVFDFSRAATREEMLRRIADAHGALAGAPAGSVRTLVDVSDAAVDQDIVRELGALAIANRAAVCASAVVGAHGQLDAMRQMVSGMSGRSFESFESMESALDWLAAQG
jgi:hypothetical protein